MYPALRSIFVTVHDSEAAVVAEVVAEPPALAPLASMAKELGTQSEAARINQAGWKENVFIALFLLLLIGKLAPRDATDLRWRRREREGQGSAIG